ncbi:MAG: alpha/beta fold hydrolase [Hyphomicrobiales bacterium]
MPEALPRQIIAGISYVDQGKGEPLLLVHGVGLNADAWRPQIEQFASTHRVIAVDMPGHGRSNAPPRGATLTAYVESCVALLDALKIEAASVIGHSMGGLVALGLALDHPQRVLRLGVLNSVYERSPEARAAVEARAAEIALSGTCGDVEQPIRRWLGETETPLHATLRHWLSDMDPAAYATAYRVFATGDRLFSGRLGELAVPALFATGDGDPNSTPAMADAMARAAPRGRSAVLAGQRHMMTLVDPASTNQLIRDLLAQPHKAFDARALRGAFGSFMTGVTVVTTLDATGTARGFTANSFTSVSLDPPLLLVCIGKQAASHDTFTQARGFAVNILAEDQKDVSGTFASKRADKFAGLAWEPSATGNPLLPGVVSWFDCARHAVVDAGDHVILMGAIRDFSSREANPLGYARGGYVTLGLEQAAVNAAARAHTIVGAILECEGQLVLQQDGHSLRLPSVGHSDQSGTASLLLADLKARNCAAELGFLFAVFENPDTRTQSIYYRGDAQSPGTGQVLCTFDALPFERLGDPALRIMLERYAEERRQGRFRIYSGNHERGEVRALG